jgi:hypothetical protein
MAEAMMVERNLHRLHNGGIRTLGDHGIIHGANAVLS